MKNPVNRIATAAPRALDSLLGKKGDGPNNTDKKKQQQKERRERMCSFDLDLSGLNLEGVSSSGSGSGSVGVGTSCGGSTAGSVVTFDELTEFAREFSLDDGHGMQMQSSGMDSPN
ncbi:hypothetical protein ACHAXR_013298 [Thalassiosira sp. AJA248-18]